jgi:diguanylate cyclase (GGDEF)-like protein
MKLRFSVPQPPSYMASLDLATRYVAVSSVVAETIFTFLYWGLNYPLAMMVIQVIANLLGVLGLLLAFYQSGSRQAGHILVCAVYFSLMGPILFSDGLNSSAMPWLVFIPMLAAMILGRQASIFWGIVSLGSIMVLYMVRDSLGPLALRPTQGVDHLSDLVIAVLSSIVAAYGNELVKSQTMHDLDETKVRLTDLANIDPLTHIYNRRYFNVQSEIALRKCAQGTPFSMLLFDIDHFKRVNDQYGHNVGDQVLSIIVGPCSEILRKGDTFARLGGEEFIVLLPDTDEDEARCIAERLRAAIEETPMHTDVGPLCITISIGISFGCSDEVTSIKEIIRRADDAMYRAKQAGRNRVVLWREIPLMDALQAGE